MFFEVLNKLAGLREIVEILNINPKEEDTFEDISEYHLIVMIA